MALVQYDVIKHQQFQNIYGKWSSEVGLDVTSQQKWDRRKDLEGINFDIVNVGIAPYTNRMDPIPGKPYEFEMEGGMFTDLFHEFQVLFWFNFSMRLEEIQWWMIENHQSPVLY